MTDMMESRWAHPGQLLALSGSYWEAFALHAAVSLGVFDAIGDERLASRDIACRIDGNADLLEHLLRALAAMDLLAKNDDEYANTPLSRERLCRDSAHSLVDIIMHHKNLVEPWSRLAECIAPVSAEVDEATHRANFLLGMRNMGNLNAPDVLKRIDLAGRARLLDLGSGPGAYSLHFCKAYPELHATLFDRPTTRPFVDSLIAEHDMADRMAFEEGDFTNDPLGGGYDLVWASHVLHSNSPNDVQDLLKRVHAALTPGGRLIIQEFILNRSCDGPVFPALFSLNMMVNGNGGKSYSITELTEMMETAGFENVAMIPLPGTSDLLVADKLGD